MDNEKSVEDIVVKAERAINAVISNHIPPQTCAVKAAKAKWKREKVVSELIVRLGTVGPSQVK